MNLHHLELFYYVARHGGISEAVRNIPYGIQQPAVSGQIIQLEEFIGSPLFTRRPFALTPPGEELYAFIQPFFSNLDRMTEKICGGMLPQVRVGASATVLREHLPVVFQNLRRKFPRLRLTLREGYQPMLEAWLARQELDLALTFVEGKPPAGLHAMPLMELPLVLVVPKGSALRTAEELWRRDRIEETLISFPGNEVVCKVFQQGLARLGVDWFAGIEVSSPDLIATYVAAGFGIGLSVALPQSSLPAELREIPLKEFGSVTFGVLWQGKLSGLMKTVVAEVQKRAQDLAV